MNRLKSLSLSGDTTEDDFASTQTAQRIELVFMNRLKSLSLSGDTTENLAFPRAIQTPSRVGILASKTSPAHKLRRRVSARSNFRAGADRRLRIQQLCGIYCV